MTNDGKTTKSLFLHNELYTGYIPVAAKELSRPIKGLLSDCIAPSYVIIHKDDTTLSIICPQNILLSYLN